MKKIERFLNGDILFHVLTLIPVKLLLGMKCIFREWCSVISSSSFVKAQMWSTRPVLTSFVFQEKYMLSHEDIKTVGYIPVEARGAKAHNTPFDFLPEEVVILASCQGLVCCCSCFPSSERALYICNPSNKEWIKLAWPSGG